jgi:hypothetical protein
MNKSQEIMVLFEDEKSDKIAKLHKKIRHLKAELNSPADSSDKVHWRELLKKYEDELKHINDSDKVN